MYLSTSPCFFLISLANSLIKWPYTKILNPSFITYLTSTFLFNISIIFFKLGLSPVIDKYPFLISSIFLLISFNVLPSNFIPLNFISIDPWGSITVSLARGVGSIGSSIEPPTCPPLNSPTIALCKASFNSPLTCGSSSTLNSSIFSPNILSISSISPFLAKFKGVFVPVSFTFSSFLFLYFSSIFVMAFLYSSFIDSNSSSAFFCILSSSKVFCDNSVLYFCIVTCASVFVSNAESSLACCSSLNLRILPKDFICWSELVILASASFIFVFSLFIVEYIST